MKKVMIGVGLGLAAVSQAQAWNGGIEDMRTMQANESGPIVRVKSVKVHGWHGGKYHTSPATYQCSADGRCHDGWRILKKGQQAGHSRSGYCGQHGRSYVVHGSYRGHANQQAASAQGKAQRHAYFAAQQKRKAQLLAQKRRSAQLAAQQKQVALQKQRQLAAQHKAAALQKQRVIQQQRQAALKRQALALQKQRAIQQQRIIQQQRQAALKRQMLLKKQQMAKMQRAVVVHHAQGRVHPGYNCAQPRRQVVQRPVVRHQIPRPRPLAVQPQQHYSYQVEQPQVIVQQPAPVMGFHQPAPIFSQQMVSQNVGSQQMVSQSVGLSSQQVTVPVPPPDSLQMYPSQGAASCGGWQRGACVNSHGVRRIR